MGNNIRVSGIDVIGDIPWGTYFCQFYQTKEDLLDILVPYFKAGLENNELCIWLISESLNADEAKEALRMNVSDFDTYLKKGQIEFIPCADWFLKDGIFDSQRVLNDWTKKINHTFDSGYEGLRLSGDAFWIKEAWGNFIDYKKEVDNIIGSYQTITSFTYSLDRCNPIEIVDIVSNHQFSLIKKKGKWERVENSGCKGAEEAAFQIAKDWEQVFDTMPDLIAIIDNECRIVRANKAMVSRLEVTPEECIGLTCHRVVHGTDKPPSFCPNQRLLKDGLVHTIEMQEGKLGGSFILSVSPLFNREGKIIGSVHVARDITERKQIEKELQESEEKYKALFENSLDAILFTLPDGSILAANPAACQMFGMTEEEIIRAGRNGIVDTSDPRLKPALEERARTDRFKGELNYRRKDGTIFPGDMSSTIFKDKSGIVRAVIIIRDITKRKQMEKKLQESEEKYRNIVETASEGIWTVDPEARTTYVNNKMTEMLGYTQEEMIGRPICDFTGREGKIIAKHNREKREQGIDESYEIKLIRKDRSPLWTFVNGKSLFDKNDKFMGSMAMVTDITERKEAEAKLKETLDNLDKLVKERTAELEEAYNSLKESERSLAEAQRIAHVGNWEWNLEANKAYWSNEMYRIFGLNPQEPAPDLSEFLNYIHLDDRICIDKIIRKRSEGSLGGIDYRIILPNGEERTVYTQAEAIFNEKNIPVRVKGIVQDITERKRAEESLARFEESRIKEIHHRIKNNLQIISSLLSLQAEKFSDPNMFEAFKDSQNRVASMALIHEELYQGKGTDNLDFAAYLHKLTQELFGSYNLRNEDISVKMDLQEAYFDMDIAIPLGMIVNELVSNSLKHAFSNGNKWKISITLQKAEDFDINKGNSEIDPICSEKGNYQYILTVADNGRGIPEEISLEDADSLGLQLVNILVEQIDGCIELRREYGTEFTIWFSNVEK